MAMVVVRDAVVHPRTVTVYVSPRFSLRIRTTYWSVFATQRSHLLQCLLRRGFRTMQFTQKWFSSNCRASISSSMTAFEALLLDDLGTNPGSLAIVKK